MADSRPVLPHTANGGRVGGGAGTVCLPVACACVRVSVCIIVIGHAWFHCTACKLHACSKAYSAHPAAQALCGRQRDSVEVAPSRCHRRGRDNRRTPWLRVAVRGTSAFGNATVDHGPCNNWRFQPAGCNGYKFAWSYEPIRDRVDCRGIELAALRHHLEIAIREATGRDLERLSQQVPGTLEVSPGGAQ